MMARRSRRPPLLVYALLVVVTLGCAGPSFEHYQHENATASLPALYQPLLEGQLRLTAALENHEQEAVVFHLLPDGARLVAEPGRASDLRDPSRAVFFRIIDRTSDAAAHAALLDPVTLNLESLDERGGGSWIRSSDGRIVVLRSVPMPRRLPFSRPHRTIVRYDFTVDDARNVAFERAYPVTRGHGWDIAPVVDFRSGSVAFLRRSEDGKHRLMLTDLMGSPAVEALAGAGFDIRAPRALSDGRLIFSANAKGYFQLYEMPFPVAAPPLADAPGAAAVEVGDLPTTRTLHPFTGWSAAPSPGAFLLANTSIGETAEPSILSIPSEFDLEAIAAFVAARNPYVNQKRALLAATLAAAAQHRFDAWPVIDLGFFYTPLVGVFHDEPEILSGDFLSEGIARGIFGAAQPLLDFRRVAALTEADLWRAEIARDAIDAEINRRVAEASELYFDILHLQRRARIDEALLDAAARRVQFFQTLRGRSRATRADLLAAAQARDALLSESEYREHRLSLLMNRLREVCGLPEGAPLRLRDERFSLATYAVQPLQQLRHVALMNHPDLEAAEASLSRAFFQREVGPARHPTAFASGTYGQSRRDDDLGTVVDDFITLTLQGKYPLGSRQVKRLFDEQWDRTIEGLQLEREAVARSTSTLIEEVRTDLIVAQRDYRAKLAALDYRAENLRVARVHAAFGPPGEGSRFDPTIEIAAEQDYLLALAGLAEVERNLAVRFVRLWWALGLADRLPSEIAPWSDSFRRKSRASIWLWYTKEAMGSDPALSELTALLDRHRPRRIYAYLYSDALLLEDDAQRQKLITLLQLCAAREVEVWALLGEPEWIESRDAEAVNRAIGRILAFNEAQPPLEPRIRGVKLDLEPHSLPGWNDDAGRREALMTAYLDLIEGARENLDGQLPLWADLSTQYFKPELASFLDRLMPHLDGASLMCYFPRADRIRIEGARALQRFGKPMEVGIELSPAAPEDVRVPPMSAAAFIDFTDDLISHFSAQPNFEGLALHDYQGMLTYFEEGTALEPGSGPGESSQ